jgi:hypothetical protein
LSTSRFTESSCRRTVRSELIYISWASEASHDRTKSHAFPRSNIFQREVFPAFVSLPLSTPPDHVALT